MASLVVEASIGFLSIAIIDNDKLILEENKQCNNNLSEIILHEIDSSIKKSGLDKKDITEIIVTKGPGSYTAIRIVLAIAKTFSFVLNIPIKVLSTLRLLSAGVDNKDKLTVPLIDARRNHVYGAVYLNDKEILKENYYDLNDILAFLEKYDKEIVFVGVDLNKFDYEKFNKEYKLFNQYAYAKNYLLVKKYVEKTDYFNAIPSYLRLTEAERKLLNDKNR